MAKKCKKCGVPLEGFGFKVAKFFLGVKPSEKTPELCNKCEDTPQGNEPPKCGCGCCH